MKGIVFDLLEQAVVQEHGANTWDLLLERADLDGVYTTLGNYPDAHLLRLVEVAASALGKPQAAIIRWFGLTALPMLAERYSAFFQGHDRTVDFMLTLNDVIHPEVRKLYPGAVVPDFGFERPTDNVLLLEYRSPRKLCAFACGLIEGAAAHYNERVAIGHDACMNRGDEHCLIRCTFGAEAA